MPMWSKLILAVAAVACTPALAQARGHRDQDEAFAARRAGQVRSLRDIEAQVVPRMPGYDYLGPEFDPASAIYRLKFMRAGSVMWIDVDGRSGAILGRSGY